MQAEKRKQTVAAAQEGVVLVEAQQIADNQPLIVIVSASRSALGSKLSA